MLHGDGFLRPRSANSTGACGGYHESLHWWCLSFHAATSANTLFALVVVILCNLPWQCFPHCADAYTGHIYCNLHCVVVVVVMVAMVVAVVVALAVVCLQQQRIYCMAVHSETCTVQW